jgi:hypothetical protein
MLRVLKFESYALYCKCLDNHRHRVEKHYYNEHDLQIAVESGDSCGLFRISCVARSREDQKAKAREASDMEVNLTWRVDTVVAFE